MGEVYRARDARLGRDVAIKILPEALAGDPERLARFRREAQVLASLSHRFIGAIYGIEEAAGRPALVLELVEGPTLAERLAQGPLPVDEALPTAIQIAEGLEAAHERGVIHRDLKPANIKIAPDGSVKLLDFGLARMLAPADLSGSDSSQSPTMMAGMTGAGFIMGTAAYMSPEQAKGKPLDRRADLWAFGCVLFEMLAGRKAFPGESATEALAGVLKSDPDWSALPKDVPATVRALLRRCLQKDPQRRLRDAGDARIELAEALERLEHPEAEPGAAPAPPRARLAIARYAALAMFFLVAGYLAARLVFPPTPAGGGNDQGIVSVSRLTHDIGFSGWPTWSPDGNFLAFASSRSGNSEIYVRRVEGGQEVNISNDSGEDIQPAFSPDGQSVAFVSARSSRTGTVRIGSSWGVELRIFGGDLWVVPALGGQARRLAADANSPAWHPDGKHVAYVSGPEGHRSILVAATAGDPPKTLLASSASDWEITKLEYSPGGGWMSFATGSNQVFILPQAGGKPRLLLDATSCSWDASGRRIYTLARHSQGGSLLQTYGFDETGGRVLGEPQRLGILTGLLREPAISRDGTRLAVSELDEALNLTLLPLAADGSAPSGPEEVMSRGQVIDHNPSFSRDGKRIAMASDRLGPQEIWIVDLESRLQTRLPLPGTDMQANFPAWSPDGRWIAVTRTLSPGRNSIWLAASDGSQAEQIVEPMPDLTGGPFSPDGKSIFYSERIGGTGQLFVLDLASRKSRQLTDSPGDKIVGARSPDGKWVTFTAFAEGNSQLWRMPIAGGKEEQLTASDERMRHMSYSPDGRWIYIQPSHRNIWRLPAAGGALQKVTSFPESGLFIEEPILSPDGRFLAYCRSHGSSSLWILTLGNLAEGPNGSK